MKFQVSTPNVFRFLDGDSITRTYKAKSGKEAVDKFYRWIENKYGYSPEIVAYKEINV